MVLALALIAALWARAIVHGDRHADGIGYALYAGLAVVIRVQEVLALFTPAIAVLPVLAFLAVGQPRRATIALTAMVVLTGLPFAIILAMPPASADDVRLLCDAIGATQPVGCGLGDDAIGWLVNDTGYSLAGVGDYIARGIYPKMFLPGFLLGIAYLGMLVAQSRLRDNLAGRLPRLLRPLTLHLIVFAVASLPMYAVLDWGRWYSFWCVQSVIYLIGGRAAGLMAPTGGSFAPATAAVVAGALATLALFWSLPFCCSVAPTPSIAAAITRLL